MINANKIRYGLVLIFLKVGFSLGAQVESIKLHFSPNYFWLESKVQESSSIDPQEVKFENGDIGIDVGYGITYALLSDIALTTELNFSNRLRRQVDPFGIQQTVKYVGVHQKIKFQIKKYLRPYIGIGANYLILKRSSADIDLDSTKSFYSSYDFSVILGLAIRFSVFEVFTDFHYGLNPQRTAFRLTPDIRVNSKSRLLRLGLTYVIEGRKEKGRDKKRKRKRRRRR